MFYKLDMCYRILFAMSLGDMESAQPEQVANSVNRLGTPLSQPRLLPDLCFDSSFGKVTDETLPYISGIFDDTLNPSFMSNGQATTAKTPDPVKALSKNHDEQSETKTLCNSWLSTPMENSHQFDYSLSFSLPNNETKPKEDSSGQQECLQATSCPGKCDLGVQSTNGTFNSSQKESSAELNSIKSSLCDSPESNKLARFGSFVSTERAGLEDKSEKHLNSTVDLCGSANVTSEQATEKLDHTVNITQSFEQKLEQSSEKLTADTKLDCTVEISQSSLVKQDKKSLNSTETLNEKLDGTVEVNCSNVAKWEQENNRFSCGSREQLHEKLGCIVAIAQSDVQEQESSLGIGGNKDGDQHCTFTKASETNSIVDLTTDMEKKSCASSNVSTIIGQPSSVSLEKADGTFTKHSTTTDLAPDGPVPNTGNATMNITKNPSLELPLESSSPNNGQKDPVSVSFEIPLCSNGTLDFPAAESKAEEQQDILRRRHGISDSESCINLDISHSSMFSLDEMLDRKPPPLVASTPIVLSRGFDRLGSSRLTEMQHRLSVINNIDKPPKSHAASADTNDGSNASVRSETTSQAQKVSFIPDSVTNNKPPSKLAVRRKIPQPSKSHIPKTQILLKPPVSQLASVTGKSKIVGATGTINQPKVSSSALHNMSRTVQLNNGKSLAYARNTATTLTLKVGHV